MKLFSTFLSGTALFIGAVVLLLAVGFLPVFAFSTILLWIGCDPQTVWVSGSVIAFLWGITLPDLFT